MSKSAPLKIGLRALSPKQLAALPQVVLLGRPNVGKSTLFNRLIQARRAVVSDLPGTTRDRLKSIYHLTASKSCVLIDMAGIESVLKADAELDKKMQDQVQYALDEADLVLFVVEAKSGLTPADAVTAEMLRRLHKPAVLVVNKADNSQEEVAVYDFAKFGIDSVVPVSSLHARGITELNQAILSQLEQLMPDRLVPIADDQPDKPILTDDRELAVAIIGRPNVGKSTLLNAITGVERAVVSPVSGTTRDAVDELIPASQLFQKIFTKWQTVRMIDTAGIRKAGQIDMGVEQWSIIRTLESIERAEVVLLMLDGPDGLTHQDLLVCQKAVDAGRPIILIVNKWDSVLQAKHIIPATPEDDERQNQFMGQMLRKAPFLHWAPVLFISAKTGWNIEYLGKLILSGFLAWSMEPDPQLLGEIAKGVPSLPPLKRVTGVLFTHSKPPTFHLQVDGRELLHFSAVRQFENILRDNLKIGPTPIKIWTETKLPKKKRS